MVDVESLREDPKYANKILVYGREKYLKSIDVAYPNGQLSSEDYYKILIGQLIDDPHTENFSLIAVQYVHKKPFGQPLYLRKNYNPEAILLLKTILSSSPTILGLSFNKKDWVVKNLKFVDVLAIESIKTIYEGCRKKRKRMALFCLNVLMQLYKLNGVPSDYLSETIEMRKSELEKIVNQEKKDN